MAKVMNKDFSQKYNNNNYNSNNQNNKNTETIKENNSTNNAQQTKTDISMEQMFAMIANLQKRLDDQEKQLEKKNQEIEKYKQENKNKENYFETKKQNSNNAKIDLDEDILLVNLFDGEFTLTTEGYGVGKKYIFSHFGSEVEIPYVDLKEIIHNNITFFQSGRVYICDKRVVEKHKLQKYYESMFKVEDFEKLRDMDSKTFFDKLIALPKAETTSINQGNEPDQIDMVLHYILQKSKTEPFPYDLIAQLERAVEIKTNKKIDIRDSLESYQNNFAQKEK